MLNEANLQKKLYQQSEQREKDKSLTKEYLEGGSDKISPTENPGEFEADELQEFKETLEEDLKVADPITMEEIIETYSNHLGKKSEDIEEMIKALLKEGFLEKTGSGEDATYELNPVFFYTKQ